MTTKKHVILYSLPNGNSETSEPIESEVADHVCHSTNRHYGKLTHVVLEEGKVDEYLKSNLAPPSFLHAIDDGKSENIDGLIQEHDEFLKRMILSVTSDINGPQKSTLSF